MGRNPDLGEPADVWDQIPEAIQREIQDHVRESAVLGYHIVVGWANAAVVVGTSVTALKRAVRKGRIPHYRTVDRGARGCCACWPLSQLWRFRQWREAMHRSDP
jgi:hypothetical protein